MRVACGWATSGTRSGTGCLRSDATRWQDLRGSMVCDCRDGCVGCVAPFLRLLGDKEVDHSILPAAAESSRTFDSFECHALPAAV